MSTDPLPPAPLRDVAQNPEATARYLAAMQRTLLDIEKNLQTLAVETRLHCRGLHVDGDRWYHARMRALPVEKALQDVLKHVNGLSKGLEKTAYKRNAFADEVKKLPGKRREKELEKQRKKNPKQLQVAPNPTQEGAQGQNSGYSVPTSIYDLGSRESA
ncbi:hypothetical protein [Streptomyces sp. 769]|uniref:hypothetical protein n=1 Tax=Streptomyces sp. 769 TaxID=1262452 RepID=UPI0005822323|nr:hypothetical protein [Streptomyces sp. 769]AJC62033.1 hypothetical protein GZL_p00103 [Streptomyces sp. 769]